MTWKQMAVHVVFSLFITAVLSVPAMYIQNIGDVFKIMGCTSNPVTGYILPTVFVLALVPKNQQKPVKVVAVIMSVMVFVMSMMALYERICDIFQFCPGFMI